MPGRIWRGTAASYIPPRTSIGGAPRRYQNGVAHFIEHMAFNGTAHFARTDMVEFFKSIGARLGRDLRGTTMSR